MRLRKQRIQARNEQVSKHKRSSAFPRRCACKTEPRRVKIISQISLKAWLSLLFAMLNVKSRHSEYKRSTAGVIDWLSAQSKRTVTKTNDLLDIAQQVASNAVSMPSNILSQLQDCIRIRQEVNQHHRQRAASETWRNQTHEYFIDVLKKVRRIFVAKQSSGTSEPPKERPQAKKDSEHHNKFADLATDDIDTEDEIKADIPENTETTPADYAGRPVRLHSLSKAELNGCVGFVKGVADGGRCVVCCNGKEFAISPEKLELLKEDEMEELLGNGVSFLSSCFLLDVEELSEEIAAAWQAVAAGESHLLTATALTNVCAQHAFSLAHAAELLNPDLNRLENFVAAAYFHDIVQWVQYELSTSYKEALRTVAEILFGDTKETRFTWQGPKGVLYGTILALELHGISPGLIEVERASRNILQKWPTLSQSQVSSLIQNAAESCITRFFRVEELSLGISDVNDFLTGTNGLIHTSVFVSCLSNAGMIVPPKRWNFLKPNFFGPQWDEASSPATSTQQLVSYAGATLPALLTYANNELRISPKQQLQAPDLKFETLMPLWHVLQTAMATGHTTLALVFTMHALLLSVVMVNGDRRCQKIGVRCRACLGKLAQQLTRDQPQYDEYEASKQNMWLAKLWVDAAKKRSEEACWDEKDPCHKIGCLQRDQAMLQNPWVAGQQLLVASLAVSIGFGAALMDCNGQLRFILHLYNALLCAEAIETIPLLEDLMDAFATSKAIWHAGRPTRDFLQSWYLSLGMAVQSDRSTGLRQQRKLVPVEPENISQAYRRAAAQDFQDCSSLRQVLDSIRCSFSEKLLGYNLIALGAHFWRLPGELVDAMDLHDQVLNEMDVQSGGKQQERKGGKAGKAKKKSLPGKAYTDAVYGVLSGKLFFACETVDSIESMAAKRGYSRPPGTGPVTDSRGSRQLQLAAQVLTTHIVDLPQGTYTLPL